MADTKKLISDEWKEDSRIDFSNISEYSLRIPSLHAKYLEKRKDIKKTLRKFILEFDRYKAELKKYFRCEYNDKDNLERLGRKACQSQIAYAQMDDAFALDDEYMILKNRLEAKKEELEMIEEILKQIDKITHTIRNAIKWECFKAGSDFS